jgi:putative membrane protein
VPRRRFLSEPARRALKDAVAAIEAVSAAEVVVAVRGTSASYLAVDLAVGAALAVATLAFALFSPLGFSLAAILVDPVLVGLAGGLLSSRLPAVHRWLTPRAVRRRLTLAAARATFVERGVQHTSGHTGILVYVALTERLVALVPDGGVTRALPAGELAAAEASLTAALAGRLDGERVAAALGALAEPLGRFLPRADDDLDELPDEVV